MTTATTQSLSKPIDRLKAVLSAESVRQQFQNALKENSDAFIASVIDLVSGDTNLQQCDPSKVVMECLRAATLKLPLNRSLGFAWVIPYNLKGKGMTPQFQVGYKGYVQLALRSKDISRLNAGWIWEGQRVEVDILSGDVKISGMAKMPYSIMGYFAFIRLTNGFEKTIYLTMDEVKAHAKRYSKGLDREESPWRTQFDAMAMKTCLRQLLSKWAPLSTEMQIAMAAEPEDAEASMDEEIRQNANQEQLPPAPQKTGELPGPSGAAGEAKPPWEN